MDNSLYQLICNQTTEIRNLKEGFLTNIFFDERSVEFWTLDGQKLCSFLFGKSLFIVRQNEGFSNLYFASTSHIQLEKDLYNFIRAKEFDFPLIVDVVGRDKDIPVAEKVLIQNGFIQYCSLMRMNRAITQQEPRQEAITYATKEKAKEIDELLNEHFNPFCEQLPTLLQIEQWISQKNILLREIDGHIAGFLIFEINGVTSYLRYWFTNPNYRNQRIGSSLLRQFFAESNATKRQIFWVIDDNENAITRYRHYGFREENMFDRVLILTTK